MPVGRFGPGADVTHPDHGHGWVQGAGHGRVSVRFETAATGPGRMRSSTPLWVWPSTTASCAAPPTKRSSSRFLVWCARRALWTSEK